MAIGIGTQLFLLANGLSVVGAPHPRERFLGFALLGGFVGLLTGVPAAMLLTAAAFSVEARDQHEKRQRAQRQSQADTYPPPWPPLDYGRYPMRNGW
jgi:hypothetical protein